MPFVPGEVVGEAHGGQAAMDAVASLAPEM